MAALSLGRHVLFLRTPFGAGEHSSNRGAIFTGLLLSSARDSSRQRVLDAVRALGYRPNAASACNRGPSGPGKSTGEPGQGSPACRPGSGSVGARPLLHAAAGGWGVPRLHCTAAAPARTGAAGSPSAAPAVASSSLRLEVRAARLTDGKLWAGRWQRQEVSSAQC
jgi:hypothetical protein